MNIIPVERTEHGLRINGTDIVPDAAQQQVLAAAD